MKLFYRTASLLLLLLFIASCNDKDPIIDDDPPVYELPHLYIELEGKDKIDTKEEYIIASLRIEGKGDYDDYEGSMGIRGRGNSTWAMPKKPYRMKLDSKESLFGLPAAKNWVLLNSYLDGTLLLESIPYKMGQMMGIPYTNHTIPVEVTINGKYQGFYVFTEHKEVAEGRIDIGDDGWLLELDVYFDEDLQFYSENYGLPVMIQYPKAKDLSQSEQDELLSDVKEEFEKLEALVYDASFPDNNYLDYFDDEAFADYMIVYNFTLNRELNHPKSTYINRKAGGKFRMGIIWDFDWGFGYGGDGSPHFPLYSAEYPLFIDDAGLVGAQFFGRIMEDPHMQKLIKTKWTNFRLRQYQNLRSSVSEWAVKVAPAYDNDHGVWGSRTASGDINDDLARVLQWMDARADYMDRYVSEF